MGCDVVRVCWQRCAEDGVFEWVMPSGNVLIISQAKK